MLSTVPDTFYKLLTLEEWTQFEAQGIFYGSPLDLKDGFIHNSTAVQIPSTTERYYAQRKDVVLVKVDSKKVVGEIKLDLAKNGEYYPHIYNGYIPLGAVLNAKTLEVDSHGKHVFPEYLS
jgi:uncharacterized protein (DUF952 family)